MIWIFLLGCFFGTCIGVTVMCILSISRMANKVPEKWVDKAVELRQQGLKLSAIAVVVDKSTSTVWQYLKKRGY